MATLPGKVGLNNAKSTVRTLRALSKRADPDFEKNLAYQPAYKFSSRPFIDNRNNLYKDADD